MTRSPTASVRAARSSAGGENGSSKNDWQAWKTFPAPADPGFSPPELVVRVKAIACEFPAHVGEPLSRWSVAELGSHVRACGLTASLSDTTIWRWLNEDAIRPWQHRCWIFPRDPDFETKAGRILDLYQRLWKGRKLATDEFVLSADEKTSIQARCRKAASLPAQPGQPMKVEHEYERLGAWVYLAALDVHQAKLFGRCEAKTGIAPFDRLVDQVMQQHPYRRARRVFWIVDNGSSHRGPRAVQRLQGKYPNLVLVHGPVHASWLNQIEIYFSIIQRKVLTPNDFSSRQELADRLSAFEQHYETIARPFEWRFTRQDLTRLLRRLGHPAVKAA
jgi:DDE superfamily endonuclease